jgi:hypothetical protein
MSSLLNNINGSLVNIDSSNYSGSAFTSRVIPSTVNPNVMPEPLNNVQAANSYIPCSMKGGKIKKNKIKNIVNMYKMKGGKRSMKKKMNKLMKMISKRRGKSRRSKRKTRKQRGGYAQYQNNLPNTPSYSLGGKLSPSMNALANPPPQHRLSNCTNCVDNYSYFTNKGFPSRGWW